VASRNSKAFVCVDFVLIVGKWTETAIRKNRVGTMRESMRQWRFKMAQSKLLRHLEVKMVKLSNRHAIKSTLKKWRMMNVHDRQCFISQKQHATRSKIRLFNEWLRRSRQSKIARRIGNLKWRRQAFTNWKEFTRKCKVFARFCIANLQLIKTAQEIHRQNQVVGSKKLTVHAWRLAVHFRDLRRQWQRQSLQARFTFWTLYVHFPKL
jgi:hypothetical protein